MFRLPPKTVRREDSEGPGFRGGEHPSVPHETGEHPARPPKKRGSFLPLGKTFCDGVYLAFSVSGTERKNVWP